MILDTRLLRQELFIEPFPTAGTQIMQQFSCEESFQTSPDVVVIYAFGWWWLWGVDSLKAVLKLRNVFIRCPRFYLLNLADIKLPLNSTYTLAALDFSLKSSKAISHHCWSIGRRGWTCTGSSWPCPISGCWGWRAGWRWAPATRWSPPGSPPSSLEVAFSNLEGPPQISNLQPLSLWRSETIAGSICLHSLIFKFESLKVIFWPSTIFHWVIVSLGNFHFFFTELFVQFCRAAFAQNQMPNNTNVDCSAIDYRLCSQITICNYWLFYQYCILAFNLKTLFLNFGLFLSRILQLWAFAIL